MTVMGLDNARTYYGEVLTSSGDLRTDACATAEAPPLAIRQALAQVHDEVRDRYYGCGLVAPEALEGARILDLGFAYLSSMPIWNLAEPVVEALVEAVKESCSAAV